MIRNGVDIEVRPVDVGGNGICECFNSVASSVPHRCQLEYAWRSTLKNNALAMGQLQFLTNAEHFVSKWRLNEYYGTNVFVYMFFFYMCL